MLRSDDHAVVVRILRITLRLPVRGLVFRRAVLAMLLGGCAAVFGSLQTTLRLSGIGFVSRGRLRSVMFAVGCGLRETAMIDQGLDGPGPDVRVAIAAYAILVRLCGDDLKLITVSGDDIASGGGEGK